MEMASGMENIVENIINAREIRLNTIKDLVSDTRRVLQNFASDRGEMATEQGENLHDFTKKLTETVDDLLKRFQTEHREMSDKLREMAGNLTESIRRENTDRLKEFKEFMGDIQNNIKANKEYTTEKLKEFHDAHKDMSEQQRKELSKYVGNIENEVKNLLAGYRDDINKARELWNNMTDVLGKAKQHISLKAASYMNSEKTEINDTEEEDSNFKVEKAGITPQLSPFLPEEKVGGLKSKGKKKKKK